MTAAPPPEEGTPGLPRGQDDIESTQAFKEFVENRSFEAERGTARRSRGAAGVIVALVCVAAVVALVVFVLD